MLIFSVNGNKGEGRLGDAAGKNREGGDGPRLGVAQEGEKRDWATPEKAGERFHYPFLFSIFILKLFSFLFIF